MFKNIKRKRILMSEIANDLFWAKLSKEEPILRYPLIFHLVDTSAVVREIWSSSLHTGAKNFVCSVLNLPEAVALDWIAFWAGLHDIGKISPAFQCRDEHTRQKLMNRGFTTSDGGTSHGTITAWILKELLTTKGITSEMAKNVSVAVGGHHGIFPTSSRLREARIHCGQGLWKQAQKEVFEKLYVTNKISPTNSPLGEPGLPFYIFLAGLTSVADWIASNERYFYYDVDHDLHGHLKHAKSQASKALSELGWADWMPPTETADFKKLFAFIQDIRPLQQEAITLSQKISSKPALVIIEAPTGEGKTEAALYMADRWASGIGQRGSYFALPTMATSNQMFGRVEKYLEARYQDKLTNLMLLHGHASLSAEFEALKMRRQSAFEVKNIGGGGHDNSEASVIASEWFTHRKRGLLAPFGVGTIDQILLAALQTRHVFVRLFGLSYKTIVVDEVHAYDAYMTTLLERLVEWLAALGSSVILLSATLPKQRKNMLLQAYQRGLGMQKNTTAPFTDVPYPRISWTTGNGARSKHIETSSNAVKKLHVQWINWPSNGNNKTCNLGMELKNLTGGEGCIAVICNTVDQAQKTYSKLKKYFPCQDAGDGYPELDLLHARYLYGDRQKREIRSLNRFGKTITKRPKRAVLVATQIIEQSLDLDFDLMVTEMAPIDLLLQRTGRLHRHTRNNRPQNLGFPKLLICKPELLKGNVPSFGAGTEAVYNYHILLRSWVAIKDYAGKDPINIPEDVEALIEEVYSTRECPDNLQNEMKEKWKESSMDLETNLEYERNEAENRFLKRPSFSGQLGNMTIDTTEEDNPDIHLAHQALTRLTGLSVKVICLYGNDAQLYLDPARSKPLDSMNRPNRETTKTLLMRSATISKQGLARKAIEADRKVPRAWREEPMLRNHYLMYFDENNQCEFEGYLLELDSELGIMIQKQ